MNFKGNIPLTFIIGLALLLLACSQMSKQIQNKSAGLNGGFEVSKNGLPVNWLLYTSKTVPNADFEIILDKKDFKEGKQSLRFDVKKCEEFGGWRSPGFTNEFSESGPFEGPGIYELSFWIKNQGALFKISAGGAGPKEGEMETLLVSDQLIEDWKHFKYEVTVQKERHLRMQLNILRSGIFWIDDVKINKM